MSTIRERNEDTIWERGNLRELTPGDPEKALTQLVSCPKYTPTAPAAPKPGSKTDREIIKLVTIQRGHLLPDLVPGQVVAVTKDAGLLGWWRLRYVQVEVAPPCVMWHRKHEGTHQVRWREDNKQLVVDVPNRFGLEVIGSVIATDHDHFQRDQKIWPIGSLTSN